MDISSNKSFSLLLAIGTGCASFLLCWLTLDLVYGCILGFGASVVSAVVSLYAVQPPEKKPLDTTSQLRNTHELNDVYQRALRLFPFAKKVALVAAMLALVFFWIMFGFAWGLAVSSLIGSATVLFALPSMQRELKKIQQYQPDIEDKFHAEWLERQRLNNFADPRHPGHMNWMKHHRPF